MVWMGTVSYGAYLWHYPAVAFLTPARLHAHGLGLVALRALATFALAATSYILVERPVMERRFWRSVQAIGPAVVAIGVTVAVVVIGAVTPSFADAATTQSDTTQSGATQPVSGQVAEQTAGHASHARESGSRSASSMAPNDAALPAALHAALARTGAFSSAPVRLLVLGDSLAITLSVGLAQGSEQAYGVEVIDQGVFGCDLDTVPAYAAGSLTTPFTTCRHAASLWADEIAKEHPDAVLVLLGRWSLTDRVVGGQRVHIGQPAEDARLLAQYTAALRSLTNDGVPVELLNVPCFGSPITAPDGSIWPEDQPQRVTALNRILSRAARAVGPKVTVVDLFGLLCPKGQFHSVMHGVTVRWADGIHITPAGGHWLQRDLLPTIDRLALESRRATAHPVTTVAP
jgi:hypothetical protein